MVQVLLPQQLQGTQPLHCAEAVPQGELILGVLGKVPGKGPVGQVLPLGVQVPGQSPLLGLRIVLRRLHPGPHRKGHQQIGDAPGADGGEDQRHDTIDIAVQIPGVQAGYRHANGNGDNRRLEAGCSQVRKRGSAPSSAMP